MLPAERRATLPQGLVARDRYTWDNEPSFIVEGVLHRAMSGTLLSRALPTMLLLAASQANAGAATMILSTFAAPEQNAAPRANLFAPAAPTSNPVPTMNESTGVPVYQTYILAPPKPSKISPIYVPDSQNTSRRRHLGW
jgi:hypothetical protein